MSIEALLLGHFYKVLPSIPTEFDILGVMSLGIPFLTLGTY